ncbi:acetyl-CoA carboxylase biotin carboxyl carrier protein subunit [Lewinellaceae bacterium SD302]|nr:acetyl-CoA carboxylase biotin carboxyl carrier protein subunit [Lewinellaceae bacterium SD302]
MKKLKASINEREYQLPTKTLDEVDLVRSGPDTYHLIRDGKTHHCRIVDLNLSEKQLTLVVDGRELDVKIKDEVDQLVEQLGLTVAAAAKSNDVFAPMPGLVLEIMVAVGEEIEAGTPLLILEAMKMENVLKAEGDGVVKAISVNQGDAVEKRQLLIEIE